MERPAPHDLCHPREHQIRILNPLDVRSCAWDIAEDAQDYHQTQLIAGAILPPDSHHDATLLELARTTLVKVIEALNSRAPRAWQLLHLIAAVEDPHFESVLRAHPDAGSFYGTLSSYPHFRLITAFLRSRLQPLRPAAAAWLHASQRISITTWAQSPEALILSNSFVHQHVLTPLNRIVFQVVANHLLVDPPAAAGQTWVFLSDLSQIGRLEALSTMLSRGREVGITVALTLEDVELLQREYGAETTGMLGLCGNYAFLRMSNPVTAHWASQVIGIEKIRILHQTKSTLSGKTSRGVTITDAKRPVISPTAFQQLPTPLESKDPVGYFRNYGRRVYKGHVDVRQFHGNHWLPACDPHQPTFVPRPESQLQFPLDTQAALASIGFSPGRYVPHAQRRKPKPTAYPDSGQHTNAAEARQVQRAL